MLNLLHKSIRYHHHQSDECGRFLWYCAIYSIVGRSTSNRFEDIVFQLIQAYMMVTRSYGRHIWYLEIDILSNTWGEMKLLNKIIKCKEPFFYLTPCNSGYNQQTYYQSGCIIYIVVIWPEANSYAMMILYTKCVSTKRRLSTASVSLPSVVLWKWIWMKWIHIVSTSTSTTWWTCGVNIKQKRIIITIYNAMWRGEIESGSNAG